MLSRITAEDFNSSITELQEKQPTIGSLLFTLQTLCEHPHAFFLSLQVVWVLWKRMLFLHPELDDRKLEIDRLKTWIGKRNRMVLYLCGEEEIEDVIQYLPTHFSNLAQGKLLNYIFNRVLNQDLNFSVEPSTRLKIAICLFGFIDALDELAGDLCQSS